MTKLTKYLKKNGKTLRIGEIGFSMCGITRQILGLGK